MLSLKPFLLQLKKQELCSVKEKQTPVRSNTKQAFTAVNKYHSMQKSFNTSNE